MLKPIMKLVENKESYSFFESNYNTASPFPMLSDFYEDIHLYVATSTIQGPGAGEGLFAATRFEAGDLVSFFNGIRLNLQQAMSAPSTGYLQSTWGNQFLDFPKELQSLDNYKASMAHKANHQNQNNCILTTCEHPRFGEITCITAIKSIEIDEEIFTDYGYTNTDFTEISDHKKPISTERSEL